MIARRTVPAHRASATQRGGTRMIANADLTPGQVCVWPMIKTIDLPAFNVKLKAAGMRMVTIN